MRTVIFDLETFTLYADTGILLCCSFKEYGTGKVTTIRADKLPGWDKRRSNSLLQFLGIDEEKTAIKWDHWKQAAYDGNRQSMNYIVEHCEQDVLVLEKAHQKMRKLIKDINERGSAF